MTTLFGGTLRPSCICLGTGPFGSTVSVPQSFEVMDTFAHLGGNFFDTAHVYAAWLANGVGASERTLGAWVRSRGVRNQVIIGTKGGHPPLAAMDQGRLNAKDLEQDLTESLERLEMDSVDIYWLHRDDPACDLAEVMETLAGFVDDGRVQILGASNWSVERIAEANALAASKGAPGFEANQPGWSLAERASTSPPLHGMISVDAATRTWHGETQMPMVAYSSQGGGYFCGHNVAWSREGFEGPCPHGVAFDSGKSRTRLRVAAEIGNCKGYLSSQVALAYLMHQPFPVHPIIGTSNAGRVQAAMTACEIELTERELSRLEGLDD